MSALKEKLDVTERGRLRKLELVVAEGMSSFVAVGEALKEIRDGKLYREAYKTFEKYVDQKWGIVRSRAYQLIDAAEAKANLSTIVDKNQRASEIANEGQLREVKDVPVGVMEQVVERAAELAGDDKITASDLKQARQEVLGEVTATTTTQEPLQFEDVEDEPESSKPTTAAKDDPFFDEKDHVAAILSLTKLGDEWLRKIKTLTLDNGGEYLSFEVQEIEDLIKRVKFKMRQSTFAHVCVDCNGVGKKCNKCKQLGWLCKGSLEFLDQRQKDLIGVS